MELLIVLLWIVGIIACIAAVAFLADKNFVPSGIGIVISAVAIFAALSVNASLVTRNQAIVDDGGQVTVTTQSLNKGVIVYSLSYGNNTYTCVDGETIKCPDIKPGDILIGQKWSNDGWNWNFRPRVAANR